MDLVNGSYIGKNVKIGAKTEIGPFCYISGDVEIGDNCIIGPYVSIGRPGQSFGVPQSLAAPPTGKVIIGHDTVIREFTDIHAGTDEHAGKITRIGNSCFIMSHTHIGHDCVIEDYCILVAARLAGHTHLMHHANMGLNSSSHQFTTVGTFCMVGCGSVLVKDIPPFLKVGGNPAHLIGINEIGLKRNGYSEEKVKLIKANYKFLIKHAPGATGNHVEYDIGVADPEMDRFIKIRHPSRGDRLLEI
nr:acyl-[acyl-carrier-protein]--UDP-N-acetylglucosamine O-acyltransferase [Candidatus Sigynarchaeota archaeon]